MPSFRIEIPPTKANLNRQVNLAPEGRPARPVVIGELIRFRGRDGWRSATLAGLDGHLFSDSGFWGQVWVRYTLDGVSRLRKVSSGRIRTAAECDLADSLEATAKREEEAAHAADAAPTLAALLHRFGLTLQANEVEFDTVWNEDRRRYETGALVLRLSAARARELGIPVWTQPKEGDD